MQITKKEIIQKLYDIEEKNDIKLGREVQKVVRSEIVPADIIKLINNYDKDFLQIYDTYNTIYLSRNKNPLYRNLRNKDLNIEEVAIAMSSLVTKILISCSKIKSQQEKQLFATAMNIETINLALTNYIVYNDSNSLIECAKDVRDLLNLLYED